MTLCNLVTVFAETKSVSKSTLHCMSRNEMEICRYKFFVCDPVIHQKKICATMHNKFVSQVVIITLLIESWVYFFKIVRCHKNLANVNTKKPLLRGCRKVWSGVLNTYTNQPVALSICMYLIFEKSSLMNWIFGLFQTGFLQATQALKIKFELD